MKDGLASESVAAVAEIAAVPRILEVICRTTGMGFSAVARVTDDRWIACAVRDEIGFGLPPGGELELSTTICDEIRDSGQGVIIDHVSEDPHFRHHPTPKMYGFESYVSVPIKHNGAFFGTLCAIDPKPALVRTPHNIAMFELFAEMIGAHLDAGDRLAGAEAELVNARSVGDLRDQFMAVLGHDLRNPLAAVDGGLRLLRKRPAPEKAEFIMGQMQTSVARMAGLIDDVMDLARTRLCGGFDVDMQANPSLADVLTDVVDEFRIAQPDR